MTAARDTSPTGTRAREGAGAAGSHGIPAELAALAVPIDGLSGYHRNARTHDLAVIQESLRTNGQYRPVVVNRGGLTGRPNEVLAGNGTVAAARAEGWTHVAVTYVDVDETGAARIVLVDNRASDLAGYDDAALADLLASLPDLSGTGYDEATMRALLAATEEPAALTDPDDAPAKPRWARSELGDVWLLGPHRLVVGDSTDIDVAARAVGGRDVDLLWTDPPYGVAVVGGTKDKLTIANDDLSFGDLEQFLTDAFTAAWSVMRPGAAYYVAGPAGDMELAFRLALRAADLPLRQAIVWVKDRFTLGRQDYQWQHESVMYGWKAGDDGEEPPAPPHYEPGHESLLYGWKEGAAHTFEGGRKQTTVWDIPRPSRNADHPTMKPVALMERAIKNSTAVGGLVLDLFGGSGSTLIAAHGTRRVAALVELDPRYADVICRRWQEHTGVLPVLEATGGAQDFTVEVGDPADG